MSSITERPLLRKQQRVDLHDERRSAERDLANPIVTNKGPAQKIIQRIDSQLQRSSPPELNDTQKDAVAKRVSEIGKRLASTMPSNEEMRKSPPGAVGKHQEWERLAKTREGDGSKVGLLQEWKNGKIALEPDKDDPDHTNFELHRPRTSTLNMDNALIDGKMMSVPSLAAMQGHDGIDWHHHTEGSPERDEELAALKERIEQLENVATGETE